MWFKNLMVLTGLIFFASSITSTIYSPARPPAIPLAVKSPYLNSWLYQASDGSVKLAGQWPQFWNTVTTGWAGMIKVDGKTYTWMGIPSRNAPIVEQVSFIYTSTKSIFQMHVENKVAMNITFLSSVTPNDMKRQSLTFSYLHVDVESLDGAAHEVLLYSDVSGDWASGDATHPIIWDHSIKTDATGSDISIHHFAVQNQQTYTESIEIGAWGDWYWMADNDRVSFQSGENAVVREYFVSHGQLQNTTDTQYRAIQDRWPVFAFCKDLGLVKTGSALFSLGLAQENSISFLGNQGPSLSDVKSLWTSYFSTSLEAATFFHTDYQKTRDLCTDLDNKIESDALQAGGSDYVTITTLSVRQTFGGLQFTGTSSDPMIFLKEISSNSDIATVDVIFPAMPILLYLNPKLLAYAMEPLYVSQEHKGNYPNTYAEHDLGTFPNAKGHSAGDDEKMPLEECGNMIIMSLAYAQRANDTAYLKKHYPLLKQWANYLVEEALIPDSQISTDDFAGPLANQTNLALKGIIGLRAMADIASSIDETDASNFKAKAEEYLPKWKEYANNNSGTPHTTLSYGDGSSHGLLYNLYTWALLGYENSFDLKDIQSQQSTFYKSVMTKYGVPLDTRHSYTKTDWQMFSAAVCSSDTEQAFYKAISTWINTTPANRPMTDLYDTSNGEYPGAIAFAARPVVGGHFAKLALPLFASLSPSYSLHSSPPSPSSPRSLTSGGYSVSSTPRGYVRASS